MEVKILQIPEQDWNLHNQRVEHLTHLLQKLISSDNGEFLYTDEEFCQLVKCSKKTAQNWRNRGYIKYVQLGAVIRYPKSAIREFVEKFSIKATV
jgi:excisionase family DNA binding protein